MDGSDDDGSGMPVYGGRRRSRSGPAARSLHVLDTVEQPTVQPAVRYYPSTGQIPIVAAPIPRTSGTSPASAAVPLPQPNDIDEATTPRRSMLPPPPPAPANESVVVAPVRRRPSATTTVPTPRPVAGVPDVYRQAPGAPATTTPANGVPTIATTTPAPTSATVAAPVPPRGAPGRREAAGDGGAPPHDVDWANWADGRPSRRVRQRHTRWERLVPLWIGLGAALLCLAGDWLPSLTPNELNLLAVTARSSDDFWALTQAGHADDALWLALVHHWFGITGASEFSFRVLAAVTIGVVAAGISTCCLQIAGARAAVFAGIVFALLPRALFDGATVSGAGFGLAFGIWSVVALTWAVEYREALPGSGLELRLVAPATRRHRYAACARNLLRWSTFVLLLVLAVYACAPMIVLLVVLPLARLLGDTNARTLRTLGGALAVAAALVTPLLVSIAIGASTSEARATRAVVSPTDLFFVSLSPTATVSGALLAVVIGVGVAVVATGLRRTVRTAGTGALWLGALWLCALSIGAIVYPAPLEEALGLWSLMGPCVAVLVGATLATARRPVVWTVLAVIAVAAAIDLALVQVPGFAEAGDWLLHAPRH
ncbi:hypothetical protein F8O01_01235 [Pseudoclavibacter chungangensis]|uniref:Glycosyltransferase RgtA/B/C/D-like domain-containing protein n=2 Tax=Pseudoclavibacter chungangensis TaxID=587635 RepID=A0A7J5C1T0_9MICO|nr:hypothetical protein [Pseudoclavibacter chungangensis]KAB1662596.1 hypothetical protein F8O01_01235 [Pseudoclavibacter chungangensis]